MAYLFWHDFLHGSWGNYDVLSLLPFATAQSWASVTETERRACAASGAATSSMHASLEARTIARTIPRPPFGTGMRSRIC